MSKIVVVGLGYVGLTTSLGLASLGHSVLGIDVNKNRVSLIESGVVPIYEPGLQDLLKKQLLTGNFSVRDTYETVDPSFDFAFICVGTPSSESGKADLSFVLSALRSVAPRLAAGAIAVMKSTMPVGSCNDLALELASHALHVASNPEFLAEGRALIDFQQPSRIIVGAQSHETASKVMQLYADIEAPKLICSLTSAETIKHASNSLLAVRLSYLNELAELCELAGADVAEVTLGMSLDTRIGHQFLKPGPGWGGSCFPKDSLELASTARALGAQMQTLEAAILSNERATERVTNIMRDRLGGRLAGKRIGVWGLAFKANTDDIRDSPAMKIVASITRDGGIVLGYDPAAKPDQESAMKVAPSALEACRDADALLVLTEWDEFKNVDVLSVKSLMKKDPVIFDTRGILDFDRWSEVFGKFMALGKSR